MTTTDPADGQTDRSRRRRLVGAGGVVALAAGAAVVVTVVLGQDPAPVSPPSGLAPAGASAAPTVTAPSMSAPPTAGAPTAEAPTTTQPDAPPVLPESRPTEITIPSIGVGGGFVDLGLTAAGELDVPQDPADVGWFTGAHAPGARGVAVVAGHVTWNGEPSVFFRLGEIAPGAEIEVVREDGSTAVFAVRDSATFPKDAFPTDEVYRSSDASELVLITCGGAYADSRYDSNVIVWADLVEARAA